MLYRKDVGHISRFLKEVDLFSGLAERNLDRIASLCEEMSFAAGDLLGAQDERGARLYIIQRGEISVSIAGGEADGGDVVVRRVGAHETFPIAALMEPPLLVTTTHAATAVDALVIARVALMELCEVEPEIGLHIYRVSCGIIMNRYRYALGMLSDNIRRAAHNDPSWKGAEV